MPYHDCFFAMITCIELFPDPDQVLFLLLFQRYIRIHTGMTEIIIAGAVV